MSNDRKQYRITFYRAASMLVDPFEFAWLLSKHEVEVVAKSEPKVRLFVLAERDGLEKLMDEVNRQFGSLVFEEVAVSVPGEGYVGLEGM